AQWIYVGDYHTNFQSQRAFLRILKQLNAKQNPMVLCLEIIRKEQQEDLEKYLKGHLSRSTFLRRINLKQSFFFDLWEHFEPIFDFARYYQIPVYGLESAPHGSGLIKRDEAMARRLQEIHQKHPHHQLLVLVGDLHIAPENLPRQVHRLLKRFAKTKELLVYQNSEKIYWKLAEANLEHQVEVVRLDSRSYCLMNTPPVVWQQSYLHWLEQEGEELDYAHPREHFLNLVEQIRVFLSLELPEQLEDLEVFTCGDLSFFERLKSDRGFSIKEKSKILKQLGKSQAHYLPDRQWVYLGSLSLNHAAEEATQFIRHLLMGSVKSPKRAEDRFYASVLEEAIGFFGSKILNPKRKCLSLEEFKAQILVLKDKKQDPSIRLNLKVAQEVVAFKHLEKKSKPISHPGKITRQTEFFLSLSRALGYMLGERLYYAMVRGLYPRPQVRKLLQNPFSKKGEAFEVYQKLIKRFAKLRLPQRF
ncbi:MAG: ChaN family lipoprotein, partial [Deltaproteobacteria bacterium]|nr:ChaN family lipoprotein [Deltaproteobacteria bacterium]